MSCSVFNEKIGRTFYLHSVIVNNGKSTFYYFSKNIVDALELPEGYEIVLSKQNGIPFLRKIK